MRVKNYGKTEAPPAGHGVTIEECPRKKGKFRVVNEDGKILDARPLERDHAINLAWNRVYRSNKNDSVTTTVASNGIDGTVIMVNGEPEEFEPVEV